MTDQKSRDLSELLLAVCAARSDFADARLSLIHI